jgi:hypothetical protein
MEKMENYVFALVVNSGQFGGHRPRYRLKTTSV